MKQPIEKSYIQSFNNLLSSCHIISLLATKNDTYNGLSFLFTNHLIKYFSSGNLKISIFIDGFIHGINSLDSIFQDKLWINTSQYIDPEAQNIEFSMANDLFLPKDKKAGISQKPIF